MKEFSIREEVLSLDTGAPAAPGATHERSVLVFRIAGHLDAHTAPELEEKIDSSFSDGVQNMIMDLGEVEYISSIGMGLLLRAHKRCRDAGGELRLARMVEKVRRIFDLLGFSDVITVYDDVESAVRAFGGSE